MTFDLRLVLRTASEADYTVESFAQDLFAATQTLDLRDFTLVGHSMGGATVTPFALDHADVEVAARCAGVLDRFVSQTVPQCLASGRSVR